MLLLQHRLYLLVWQVLVSNLSLLISCLFYERVLACNDALTEHIRIRCGKTEKIHSGLCWLKYDVYFSVINLKLKFG